MYAALRTAVGLSRRGPLLSRLRGRAAAPPLGPAAVVAILGLVFVFADRLTAVDVQSRPLDPVLSPYHDYFEVGKQLRISSSMSTAERNVRYSELPGEGETIHFGVIKRLPKDKMLFEIPEIIVKKRVLKTPSKQKLASSSIDTLSDQMLGGITSFGSAFPTKLSMPSFHWFNDQARIVARRCLAIPGKCNEKRLYQGLRSTMILEKNPMAEPDHAEHEAASLTRDAQLQLDAISGNILTYIINSVKTQGKGFGPYVTTRLMNGWVGCLKSDAIWLEYAARLNLPFRDQLFVCGSIKTIIRDFCVKTARVLFSTEAAYGSQSREGARQVEPVNSKRRQQMESNV